MQAIFRSLCRVESCWVRVGSGRCKFINKNDGKNGVKENLMKILAGDREWKPNKNENNKKRGKEKERQKEENIKYKRWK